MNVWPGSFSLLNEGVMGLPCAEAGLKWSMPPIPLMDSRPVRVLLRILRCISPWFPAPPPPRLPRYWAHPPEFIWCSESEKYCASCKEVRMGMYKVHSIFQILNIKLSLVDGRSAEVAWMPAEPKTKEIFISSWFLAPLPPRLSLYCAHPPKTIHLIFGIRKILCFQNRRNKGCEIDLYTTRIKESSETDLSWSSQLKALQQSRLLD